MLFMKEQVRKFLITNGHVFTFRLEEHAQGPDWITDKRGGKKICDVTIRLGREINSPEELEPYVFHSSFQSMQNWLKTIATLRELNEKEIEKKLHGYVYSVYTEYGWTKQFRTLVNNTTKQVSGFVKIEFGWKTYPVDIFNLQMILVNRFKKPNLPPTYLVFPTNDELFLRET